MKNINNLFGSIILFKGIFLNVLYYDIRFKVFLRFLKILIYFFWNVYIVFLLRLLIVDSVIFVFFKFYY